MDGFIIIDKLQGISSAKAVAVVKRLTKAKVGHLGTLDPDATGVLPVAIGKATKLFDYLTFKQKKYIAEYTFGVSTDTLDASGVVTDTTAIIPTKDMVLRALSGFIGEIEQLPPNYSALSIGGVRAYKLARSGAEFNLAPRKVMIYNYQLLEQTEPNKYTFEILCGGGTYIRSLARDLGNVTGSLAIMSKLRRTQSGCFTLKNSVLLDTLKESGQIDEYLLPIDYALTDLPRIDIDSEFYRQLSNGVKIPFNQQIDGKFVVYCNGTLFGIAVNNNDTLQMEYNLYNG
ncbi:MAG: tRNA pseudouridine(55) synthase TruB [Clostridia bacterium]